MEKVLIAAITAVILLTGSAVAVLLFLWFAGLHSS
jgi:hypothetical protein